MTANAEWRVCLCPGRMMNATAAFLWNHFIRWCAHHCCIVFFFLYIYSFCFCLSVFAWLRLPSKCQMSHKQEITRSVNEFCGSKAAKQLKQPTHCWSIVCCAIAFSLHSRSGVCVPGILPLVRPLVFLRFSFSNDFNFRRMHTYIYIYILCDVKQWVQTDKNWRYIE